MAADTGEARDPDLVQRRRVGGADDVVDHSGARAAYADLGRTAPCIAGARICSHPPSRTSRRRFPRRHQFKTLDGAIPRVQAASIRVTSDIVGFPIVDGSRRRIKIPAAAGKSYVGLVFLFSSVTGELVAILQDGILQRYSVGAINAIGAKHLSRADSSSVGLIGAGNQAAPQLEALTQVRPIGQVRVFSPVRAEAEALRRGCRRHSTSRCRWRPARARPWTGRHRGRRRRTVATVLSSGMARAGHALSACSETRRWTTASQRPMSWCSTRA